MPTGAILAFWLNGWDERSRRCEYPDGAGRACALPDGALRLLAAGEGAERFCLTVAGSARTTVTLTGVSRGRVHVHSARVAVSLPEGSSRACPTDIGASRLRVMSGPVIRCP